jgi:hypothetical protein
MNHYLPRSPEGIRDENEQKINIYPYIYLSSLAGLCILFTAYSRK